MQQQSIRVENEKLPLFQKSTITDRLEEEDSVCVICRIDKVDGSALLKSYRAWAKGHEWDIVKQNRAEAEWSLMLTKGQTLLNLSLRYAPQPLLLVTIFEN